MGIYVNPRIFDSFGSQKCVRTTGMILKTDPFWLDPKDPHVANYAKEGVLDPTVPNFPSFNPGYAECNAQQIWGVAAADVIREGMTPQAAAEKALNRMGQILVKYPIAQS